MQLQVTGPSNRHLSESTCNLPSLKRTATAPQNWCLEDKPFCLGEAYFQGRTVRFRKCRNMIAQHACVYFLHFCSIIADQKNVMKYNGQHWTLSRITGWCKVCWSCSPSKPLATRCTITWIQVTLVSLGSNSIGLWCNTRDWFFLVINSGYTSDAPLRNATCFKGRSFRSEGTPPNGGGKVSQQNTSDLIKIMVEFLKSFPKNGHHALFLFCPSW